MGYVGLIESGVSLKERSSCGERVAVIARMCGSLRKAGGEGIAMRVGFIGLAQRLAVLR